MEEKENEENGLMQNQQSLFTKQIELMEQLDSKFGQWIREELDKVLEKFPYDDKL